LHLDKVKGNARSKTGDKGVITRFSRKPVKLRFMNAEVKSSIVDKRGNPFKKTWVVDGQVTSIDGEPELYKIYRVHEATTKKSKRNITLRKPPALPPSASGKRRSPSSRPQARDNQRLAKRSPR
jgi:hypothetical protein